MQKEEQRLEAETAEVLARRLDHYAHSVLAYLDPPEKVELTGSRAGPRIGVSPGFPI